MGMFTYVNPAEELLPEICRGLGGWQTKDVIECAMETLDITPDGKLVHVWWEREFVKDDKGILGGYFEPRIEHRDTLDYHGDMEFYTTIGTGHDLIELVARFAGGQLQWIREYKVSQSMQECLRLSLDDLFSEYFYSEHDLSGASHYQIIKAEDKEKFLDDMAAKFRKRVEESLYEYDYGED